jgi:hypothetical protein
VINIDLESVEFDVERESKILNIMVKEEEKKKKSEKENIREKKNHQQNKYKKKEVEIEEVKGK